MPWCDGVYSAQWVLSGRPWLGRRVSRIFDVPTGGGGPVQASGRVVAYRPKQGHQQGDVPVRRVALHDGSPIRPLSIMLVH